MAEAARIRAIQAPIIPIVADWIRAHPGTVSLGQGVVNYPPPPEVHRQLERFWADPAQHCYQAVPGLPELRDRLARKLRAENRIDIDAANAVVVTAGGNQAFMNAVLAVTDPGDEVVVPGPFYFNHEMAIAMAGCQAVVVATDAAYQLDVARMSDALTPRTRAVVTVSPNNPTGAVYPEADLRAVQTLCHRHGIYHIHDEAYEYFIFDGARHFSPGSVSGNVERAISLFSFSKAYGFASWRLGYMVVPAHLFEAIRKIQDTILICPPVISQFAAIGALEAGRDYCAARLPALARVRAEFLAQLGELAPFCRVPRADGAFYFLLQLDSPLTSMEAARRLVVDHGVAVIPGNAFGLQTGCFLRVAYAALSPERAQEALGRLVAGLRAIRDRTA
jgi:aspartate/methionine/tyrosine aminotransferase